MASHELLEHTGEVSLRVRGGTFADVLAEAGRALAKLALRGRPATPTTSWTSVAVESADRESLLVDWLNELIFLAERDRVVPTEFDIREAGETALQARIRGVPVPEPPALVKAATLHRVRVEAVAEGMEADVILDV
jgi:SHS2 domain-containing protein